MDDDSKFVWIDMETTGLIPQQGVPLEVGFLITDVDLNELNRSSWTIYEEKWDDAGLYEAPKVDKFVLDMHDKSGLWEELPEHGCTLGYVQGSTQRWLIDNGVGTDDPMCGSSVQFDRLWAEYWLPGVFDQFSYRNIDISTLKELMRRLSPDIYAEIDGDDNTTKRGLHRVLPDLEDTISEFKFYRKEFLYVPSDFA